MWRVAMCAVALSLSLVSVVVSVMHKWPAYACADRHECMVLVRSVHEQHKKEQNVEQGESSV